MKWHINSVKRNKPIYKTEIFYTRTIYYKKNVKGGWRNEIIFPFTTLPTLASVILCNDIFFSCNTTFYMRYNLKVLSRKGVQDMRLVRHLSYLHHLSWINNSFEWKKNYSLLRMTFCPKIDLPIIAQKSHTKWHFLWHASIFKDDEFFN